MAKSPAHKWGQVIGDLFEEGIRELLENFAQQNGLYLDYKRARPARSGVKVRWKDKYGNSHDLDYVLEAGGTDEKIGAPKAFIEVAWRRYTKHSKNKAQEIEGAVLPLLETYNTNPPFLGAILSGEFTSNALRQLESKGFQVLYISYDGIIKVFDSLGIDASSTERTEGLAFEEKLQQLAKLDRKLILQEMFKHHREEVEDFFRELKTSIERSIRKVRVLALHGASLEVATVQEAIEYIEAYDEKNGTERPINKFEIDLHYNNGDVIHAEFQTKKDVIGFLSQHNIAL